MSTNNANMPDFISVKGARMHNLKNVDIEIPKKKLIVITGVSGSGKSSLAFDTLFAEGQRRYIESLSAYARQFLGKLQKPEVESISGLSPAIAIKQKVNTQNPRSTVGTTTEIYDYIKLLYTKIGKTISPISNKEVKKHQVNDVVNYLSSKKEGLRVMIMTKVNVETTVEDALQKISLNGFSRVKIGDTISKINDINTLDISNQTIENIWIIVDRLTTNKHPDNLSRLADSVEIAFSEGNGKCSLEIESGELVHFSNLFERDGIKFIEPTEHLFSFNNPYGACSRCEGFGTVLGIDEQKVIPNMTLSVYEGAVSCWKGEKLRRWKDRFILHSANYNFPVHRPYLDLNEEEKKLLWDGAKGVKGISQFFYLIQKENYKVQNRVILARYRGKNSCPSFVQTNRFLKVFGYSHYGYKI
ncbi:MAG: excinuclease ABC subunit A, partial [Bacteroidota bacterium]|nr:excinuclease ABC subunit A [Bacteroidota bacterium]